jgi:maltose phosphorylase
MNGEECHNEWEITFEEIHRNGAIAFAIYNFYRYTGDYSYIPEKGLEVLLVLLVSGIKERIFQLNQYVILCTGPNEYENVNNNFYTNYIAKWCLEYTFEQIQKVSLNIHPITRELPKK